VILGRLMQICGKFSCRRRLEIDKQTSAGVDNTKTFYKVLVFYMFCLTCGNVYEPEPEQ